MTQHSEQLIACIPCSRREAAEDERELEIGRGTPEIHEASKGTV